jgi:hypothetical protein
VRAVVLGFECGQFLCAPFSKSNIFLNYSFANLKVCKLDKFEFFFFLKQEAKALPFILINLSFQNAETDMDAFDLFFEKQMRWGFH